MIKIFVILCRDKFECSIKNHPYRIDLTWYAGCIYFTNFEILSRNLYTSSMTISIKVCGSKRAHLTPIIYVNIHGYIIIIKKSLFRLKEGK